MEKQKWINNGWVYFPIPGYSTIYSSPGTGVFQIVVDPDTRRLGLGKISDTFEFNFKIYDLGCEDIFQRVITTWFSDSFIRDGKNLGVIFNGLKGTGKTIAAKLLSNRLGLPVIVVSKPISGLLEFIQSLCFECIVLIDEAEKTFDDESETLLKMIDGVYNNSRKLYLLTTNELTVDENLLGRPGRIRYIKQFSNLTIKAVNDYIEDNLIDKSLRAQVVRILDKLSISTIDILKSLVEEANIYGELPDDILLNLPRMDRRYKIIRFGALEPGLITTVRSYIASRLKPGESVSKWLYRDKDGRRVYTSNANMLTDIYPCRLIDQTVTRKEKAITNGSKYDDGDKILSEPDEHGFFEVTDGDSDMRELCCLEIDYGIPSLYEGRLVS